MRATSVLKPWFPLFELAPPGYDPRYTSLTHSGRGSSLLFLLQANLQEDSNYNLGSSIVMLFIDIDNWISNVRLSSILQSFLCRHFYGTSEFSMSSFLRSHQVALRQLLCSRESVLNSF